MPRTNEPAPGDHVRHVIRYGTNGDFVGIVLETCETRGIGWLRTTATVRWVEDNGDPSDTPTSHAVEELERIAPA